MHRIFNYTLLIVVTVGLLASSGDITITWTSPIIPKLYSDNPAENPLGTPITEDQESWIGSLINIGAMIGPFPYGLLAEKMGRKIALLGIAVPYIASYLTLAFSKNISLYYFARLLAGLALGGSYVLLPMYVAELAEDSNRGMLSVTLNVFWTFGNLLPYVAGPYLSVLWFNLGLALFPIAFFCLFMVVAPETPYYLMSMHKKEEAGDALRKLRGTDKVEQELKHIEDVLMHDDESNILDLFKNRTYLKALGVSVVLIMSQQLSGINAVLFYTEEIFDNVKDIIPADVSSIVIGLVLFSTSFITPFIVDRLGRRVLLMVSGLGMLAAHLIFGFYFYLELSGGYDALPIMSLVVYIVMYNIGFGPIPWTISSELFPANVKSMAASLVSFSCWFTSFVVTKFFVSLKESLGEGETFWLFAWFCLLAVIFTYFFVPETKGKSFVEIQEALEK